MKSFTSAILILAYVVLTLRPSLPLVEYALQKDFIANTLCENKDRPALNCAGSCYLKKQLKKAAQDSPSDSDEVQVVVVPFHLQAEEIALSVAPPVQANWGQFRLPDHLTHSVPLSPPPRS